MEKNKQQSLRGRFLQMQVGDTIVVLLTHYRSQLVRTYAYELGRDYGRKFTTKYDACAQANIVTRES